MPLRPRPAAVSRSPLRLAVPSSVVCALALVLAGCPAWAPIARSRDGVAIHRHPGLTVVFAATPEQLDAAGQNEQPDEDVAFYGVTVGDSLAVLDGLPEPEDTQPSRDAPCARYTYADPQEASPAVRVTVCSELVTGIEVSR